MKHVIAVLGIVETDKDTELDLSTSVKAVEKKPDGKVFMCPTFVVQGKTLADKRKGLHGQVDALFEAQERLDRSQSRARRKADSKERK